MVSVGESRSHTTSSYSFHSIKSSSSTATGIWRERGRSMRTVRSSPGIADSDHLMELASNKTNHEDALSHYSLSLCSSSTTTSSASDISCELQRLASTTTTSSNHHEYQYYECEPSPVVQMCMSPGVEAEDEDVEPSVVQMCIDALRSPSLAVKRSGAATIRLLAKNRPENRALIAESGAIPALVPLLRCTDPWAQEHAVTALLNLSLLPENKMRIASAAGAVKSLIHALKTGSQASKQNAATALTSLAMVERNRLPIGASGAIPPLVSLLLQGSARGKKDALTTLYKLCSLDLNKERALSAGAVPPLIALLPDQSMADKALVVLSSLAAIPSGVHAIVRHGGIPALLQPLQQANDFALITLLQLCAHPPNRALLLGAGGLPPLLALSHSPTASPRSRHKAQTLLRYLRELTQDAPSSSTP